MAWWKRPNTTVANIAEMAAAGIPFFEEQPPVIEATPDSPASSQMDMWMTAFDDRMACGHFTQVDERMHFTKDVNSSCKFWSEGILSVGMAAFGLIGNLVSIYVLSVPEMRSTAFNRLLLTLAIVDCLFICPAVIVYIFEAFKLEADWYNYLFPVVLYPCSEIALCSSIYLTVAIAVERYIGLCRPFRRLSSRPCPAKAYILPVFGLSIVLNIPKFLEAETVITYDFSGDVNITNTRVGLTALRIDPDYITYYTMWTRLLVTGIFPLAMLAILNTKIYLALRRSKAQLRSLAIRAALPMAILGKPATPPSQLDLRIDSKWPQNGHHVNGIANGVTAPLNPTATPPKSPRPAPMNRSVSAAVVETANRTNNREPIARSQSTAAAAPLHVNGGQQPQQANAPANDLNLAPVLFGVVIVFTLCNTLRVFLNMYDFSVVDDIINCEKKKVGRVPPAWVMCSVSVSHFLLMINSSVNFLVYCVAGSKFRAILYQHLSSLFKRLRPNQQPQHANGIEAALLQKPLPPLPPVKNVQRGRNRLLEAALRPHDRIVEV